MCSLRLKVHEAIEKCAVQTLMVSRLLNLSLGLKPTWGCLSLGLQPILSLFGGGFKPLVGLFGGASHVETGASGLFEGAFDFARPKPFSCPGPSR